MKFLIILNSNIKRMLKNKKNIISSFIVPAFIILLFAFIFSKIGITDNENALIVSDKGTSGQVFVSEMKKSTGIKIYSKDDAIEQVKKKRLPVCYEVPADFTEMISKGEKPKILSYKIDNDTEPGDFEFNANSVISKMLMQSEFKSHGVDVSLKSLSSGVSTIKVTGQSKNSISDIIILNMLISFVFYGAIGITLELFDLKKQNILKRSFTTANKPDTIIGGVLTALFIVTALNYCAVFLITNALFPSGNLSKTPVILLNIVFITLVALSLGVFISRIIKNENLVPMVLQIVIALTCFVGGSFMPYELLPKSITMFSKFTPQYWALQSINTGNVWMSFMVLLFSIALFTAGTFKAKSFM